MKREGGSNSVVESQPSKLLVAGSIPVSRSSLRSRLHSRPRAMAGKPAFALERDGGSAGALGDQQTADLSAVARSAKADVAQLAERVLGKDEVTSSILVIGSNLRSLRELRLASQPIGGERRLSTEAQSAKVDHRREAEFIYGQREI